MRKLMKGWWKSYDSTQWVPVRVVVASALACGFVVGPAAASWASRPQAPVTGDRWVRSVCGDVSGWLDERTTMDAQVQTILAGVAGGNISVRAARQGLTKAYATGASAATSMLTSVKSAGTPDIVNGKNVASQYADTLSGYVDAYATASTNFSKDKSKDAATVATAAQQVNTALASAVAVVGADPIEDLRAVPELANSLAAACGPIEAYLVERIDAPCRGAVDAVQPVLDAERRFSGIAEGSPEEDAAVASLNEAERNLRQGVGGCNAPAVASGACRTVLQTAAAYLDAVDRFMSTPDDSSEEAAAENDITAKSAQLVTQLGKCPK